MPMPKKWDTNVAEALMHLQARYAHLSAMAERAIKTSRQTGQKVPDAFIHPYSLAVSDYRKFGSDLFDTMGKKGLSVEQVIWRHGKPEPDPTDPKKFRTVKIAAPLVPPVFSGVAGMVGETEVGIFPVGAVVIGGLVVVGTAIGGYFAVKALHEIRIGITGPDYNPDKQAEASLKLFEGLRRTGLSPEQSAELTKQGTTPPPNKGVGIGGVVLGAAAILGGAYAITHWPKKAA
jgi:hypothetical protein